MELVIGETINGVLTELYSERSGELMSHIRIGSKGKRYHAMLTSFSLGHVTCTPRFKQSIKLIRKLSADVVHFAFRDGFAQNLKHCSSVKNGCWHINALA